MYFIKIYSFLLGCIVIYEFQKYVLPFFYIHQVRENEVRINKSLEKVEVVDSKVVKKKKNRKGKIIPPLFLNLSITNAWKKLTLQPLNNITHITLKKHLLDYLEVRSKCPSNIFLKLNNSSTKLKCENFWQFKDNQSVWRVSPKSDENYRTFVYNGSYTPRHCQALQRVALIIPYRDREKHLEIFLHHIHQFLQKQSINYVIVLVEQIDRHMFNRGSLLNVGVIEAVKMDPSISCIIFHDVDLLPLRLSNFYNCLDQPIHMSSAIDVLHYKLPYQTLLGGVSSFPVNVVFAVNGFANIYWGWGAEDDDLSQRVHYYYRQNFHRFKFRHYHNTYDSGRYTMAMHNHSDYQQNGMLYRNYRKFLKSGLNTLTYNSSCTATKLYMHIKVSIKEEDWPSYKKLRSKNQWKKTNKSKPLNLTEVQKNKLISLTKDDIVPHQVFIPNDSISTNYKNFIDIIHEKNLDEKTIEIDYCGYSSAKI
ncbi:hypothetical protein SNEBB_004832 [Seison nebaliae]|nr:hypothetical protein SNEBB_004832 [Seison nebaliae]